MAERFEAGEIVDVTIKGVRVTATHSADEAEMPEITVLLDCEIGSAPIRLPHHWPMVTATRVAPAEWPPQIGDVWRDRRGDIWFAVNGSTADADPEISLVFAGEDYRATPDKVNQMDGPLTLVRREASDAAGSEAS